MLSSFNHREAEGSLLWRRLPSGLELVVDPIPGCGVVGVALGYRAGARDEPSGQEGLAHLLEHLMFRGSSRHGAGVIDRTAAELGGSVNAYTGQDQMVFHWVLPSGPWERAVELEVERMESLELSQEVLRLEQEIVKAEIDAACEDGWDRLERAVFRRLWGKHPYGRPVLGKKTTVARIGKHQIQEFHRQELGPARAVCSVAGDVDPLACEKLEGLWVRATPRGTDRRALAPPCPPSRLVELSLRAKEGPGRALLVLPLLELDCVAEAGIELLVALLGLGRASRLQSRLVEEEGLATSVTVDLVSGELASSLVVAGELVDGVSPRDWKRLVFAELETLRRSLVPASELERARTQLEVSVEVLRERALDRALERVWGVLERGDPWAAESLVASAQQIRPEELQQYAQRWLHPERGAVLGVLQA